MDEKVIRVLTTLSPLAPTPSKIGVDPRPCDNIGGMWHGYVERHPIDSTDRKAASAEARLAQPTDVVLKNPDEVADWMRATITDLAGQADATAQQMNVLRIHPGNVYRSTASKGRSVYASVHANGKEVWDVIAEVAKPDDDGCPVGTGGHNFQEVKGVWRCTKCGKIMR